MTYEQALEILGVSADASMDEIKKKYRTLMLMTHPDVTDSHGYAYEASDINVAYEYLLHNVRQLVRRKQEREQKFHWNAPVNANAYAARDIYHYVEDADGERIGEATIDHGRYIWIEDEDFSLLLKSLLNCSRMIVQEADERMNMERGTDVRLLSEITYLLAQQYVDSDMILAFLATDVTGKDEKIYHIDAMLELEGRYLLRDGELLYPSRLCSHRLYVSKSDRSKKKKELGYISFKDDRLYYGIIPLLERRKALVKMVVENADRKRLNGKSYVEVSMYLKMEKENKGTMIDSINLKIDRLLKNVSLE